MNDKIEQRARELLAAEYERRNWDSVFVAKVRRGAYTTATDDAALRAIAAALRENTKPESQAAGGVADEPLCDPVLEDRIIEVVREYGSYRAAAKALGIDYVYLHRLKHGARINPSDAALEKLGLVMSTTRTIRRKNALSTPASHDAQQPDREFLGRVVRMEWMAWAQEQPVKKPSWLVPWDEMSEADREVDRRIGERIWNISNPLFAQQPAVVGDGHLATLRKLRDDAAGLVEDYPVPCASRDEEIESVAALDAVIAALTPAATPGCDSHSPFQYCSRCVDQRQHPHSALAQKEGNGNG